MKKVCSNCGSANRSTAYFCSTCGSRLLTTIPPAVALAGEQEAAPPQPLSEQPTPHSLSEQPTPPLPLSQQPIPPQPLSEQPTQTTQNVERREEAEEASDSGGEPDPSNIPTGTLIPEFPLTDEPSVPDLPSSAAIAQKVEEMAKSPSPISFKKENPNSSPERQKTTVLALPAVLEARESITQQQSQKVATDSEEASSVSNPLSKIASAALPPSSLVANRFEIIDLIESDELTNLYSVYDRVACPSCGSTENQPNDNYCWECGFDLSREYEPVSCQLREALSNDALDAYEGERFSDKERFYLLLEEDTSLANSPSTEPVQSVSKAASIKLSVGYESHMGMVRQLNEDSLSVFMLTGLYESRSRPSLGLFIVADGMGGHAGGEIASKFVIQTITERLVRRLLIDHFHSDHAPHEEAIKPRVEEAIQYANEQLYRLAQERYSDMGSTATLALVIDERVVIANVGDSRVYLHRDGKLKQITKDHSVVASLIAAGMIQPHEIYTHPERNVVYRSMGNRPTVEIDLWEEELKSGDKLLLCSDGLWEAIHDEGIQEVLLTYTDVQAAASKMVQRSNLAGGEDNITVILAQVD